MVIRRIRNSHYLNVSELSGSNSNSRNWKGIAISLLVIFVVCTLIVIAVIIKRPPKGVQLEQKAFSLDDIMYKSYEAKRFSGMWTNNNMFVYQDDLNLLSFDCKTMKKNTVLSNDTIKQLVGDKFKISVNQNPSIILISYDMKHIFRHSVVSRYKIFNTISNMSFDVVPTELYSTDQIQNALLSPNTRLTTKKAFVYQNNIYLMSKYFDGSKESIQLTIDGSELTIYNGITDWLYEEEILYQTNAMWWSPDNSKLAYIKFNDSQVKFYEFPLYDGSPYGHMSKIRYPKPDTPNPEAAVFIYNTDIGDTLKVDLPLSLVHKLREYYIWSVKWHTEDSIIIVYVNRKQTRAITVINDATIGKVLLAKEYPSAPLAIADGWFVPTGLLSTSRYNYYFQIWPFAGYRAIVSFDSRNGEAFTITNHRFDVTEMLSFNERTGEIFYLATNGDPKQKHLFKKKVIDLSSNSICLTCNDSVKIPYEDPSANSKEISKGESCIYHAASFSVGGDYYVLECLGDRIPITFVKNIENSSISYEFETNEELKVLVESRILPRKSYLRVFFENETNSYADAELLYPPNFEPAENNYPVLVFVYNGPSSQMVDFQFRIRKFETYLCVNYGVIIAIVDGRGTDGNGDHFMKVVSRRLGELETIDQITLANALKREVYTDDDRFAIWGWSYGGFLSAMALFKENSPYRCAVSGAPVVDWLLYDSAYTERYLGSYAENRHSYEISNLTNMAKTNARFYDRKKMLLIHGTGDDNVHFQNSAILAKILRNTKLEFDFEVYPDVQHTPDDPTQRHLYQKITKFLLNCYNMNYQNFYEQLNYQHLIGDVSIAHKSEEGDKE